MESERHRKGSPPDPVYTPIDMSSWLRSGGWPKPRRSGLELAVGARCDSTITFNERDFAGAASFGLRVEGPKAFLKRIGELT
jgi:hypothetical protein